MNDNELVDINLIREMLYNDEAYVKEFSEASIQSFTEFRDNFKKHLQDRDLDELRRAGHKIKPVAQMLKLDRLLEIYDEGKTALTEDHPKKEKQELIQQMDEYCSKLVLEFGDLI